MTLPGTRLVWCAGLVLLLSLAPGCNSGESAGTSAVPAFDPPNKIADKFDPGQPAFQFSLDDLSGAKRAMADYKGKLIVLNFWATWCAPCVAEMPAFERLHKTLKDKGLVVIGINSDSAESREQVETFVKERGITFPILLDPEMMLAQKYGLTGFPETFLIGADGKFVAIEDPETRKLTARIISDRAWDSDQFIKIFSQVLEKS